MKALIEEYGSLIISIIVGLVLMSIGFGMFVTIKPFIDAYIESLL